jgi:hypothetical protein
MATPNYKSFALLFQKLSSKMEYKSKNLEKSKPDSGNFRKFQDPDSSPWSVSGNTA